MRPLHTRPSTRSSAALAIAACAFACAACSGDDEELRVSVVDGATGSPVAGALVAVEEGGIYLANPDLTKGNPSYKYGGQADGSGVISLPFTSGEWGLHIFADGYRYGPERVQPDGGGTEVTVELAPELPDDVNPLVSDVALDPATVAPGGTVTVRATVAAGVVSDPELAPSAKLSEEVLLIAPALGLSLALDPPAPGCSVGEDPSNPRGCPDGEFTATFAAPADRGTYAYHFVVSSEGCVTSDRRELTLVVQ
jgi:hypothetical protein